MESCDRAFSRRVAYCHDRSFLSERVSDSLRRIYENLHSIVSDSDFRTVPVHGNFEPHNVLVERNGVCVLDFESHSHGPACIDVCSMWTSLWAKSLHHVLVRRCLGRLTERFVGKSLENLRLDTQSLQLGMLQVLVQKTYFGLKDYLGRRVSVPWRLRSLRVAYCYRHMLVHFMNDLGNLHDN